MHAPQIDVHAELRRLTNEFEELAAIAGEQLSAIERAINELNASLNLA